MWSSRGCSVKSSTKEQTTCVCNHLTSFAVLMERDEKFEVIRNDACLVTDNADLTG